MKTFTYRNLAELLVHTPTLYCSPRYLLSTVHISSQNVTWHCDTLHLQEGKPQRRESDETNPLNTAPAIDLLWFVRSSMTTLSGYQFTALTYPTNCTLHSFLTSLLFSSLVALNFIRICSSRRTLTHSPHLQCTPTLSWSAHILVICRSPLS